MFIDIFELETQSFKHFDESSYSVCSVSTFQSKTACHVSVVCPILINDSINVSIYALYTHSTLSAINALPAADVKRGRRTRAGALSKKPKLSK